jgi:multicomponent Na+:H+ antiporter subunit F
LLYSLLNFVGVIAALRLVERGKFFANEDEGIQKKLLEASDQKDDSGDKNA